MRKLTLRKLFSLTGMAVLLGAVALVAYGASIDCTTQTECVGTEFSDTMDDSSDTVTLRALGGDDTISLTSDGGTPQDIDESFAGPGDDRIVVTNIAAAEIAFGEDGDDSFKVSGDRSGTQAAHTLDGGRGDDFFLAEGTSDGGSALTVFDGPGADTILIRGDEHGAQIRLTADNEQDTVRAGPGSDTIELQKGSGRDVIDCGDGGGTVMLQGNRKATDTFGNNLRKAALLGGTAQTGCDTIIP